MKKKKKKLIKNVIFLVFIFVLPILIKILHLNALELISVILIVKGINEIYSNFNLGIILHKNFGYYH